MTDDASTLPEHRELLDGATDTEIHEHGNPYPVRAMRWTPDPREDKS